MIYEIDPVAKPRMTRRDKWMKRPVVVKYRDYCDFLKAHGQVLGPEVQISFGIRMPDSWSEKKKKKMEKTPHQQKPDIDNLIKGVLDALCEDDSYIFRVAAIKYWSRDGVVSIS